MEYKAANRMTPKGNRVDVIKMEVNGNNIAYENCLDVRIDRASSHPNLCAKQKWDHHSSYDSWMMSNNVVKNGTIILLCSI